MGACPKGLVPAFVPGQEKATVCLAETCEREVDERHCCVKAVSCDAFESTANCPAGQRLKDHPDRLMCRHSVCVQSDAETCCGQEHTCSMFSPWDCPTGHALRMGTDATSRSCSGATCKRKDWSKCCKQVGSITLEAEEDMVFVDMDKGGDGLIDKDELSKDANKLRGQGFDAGEGREDHREGREGGRAAARGQGRPSGRKVESERVQVAYFPCQRQGRLLRHSGLE
eukprot:SRR837773.6558.p1 GENE.SRR837773.6558~~SRR837773.6558.p1  ORF type:complete len:259 (+),score=36.98 SRR837773.6558:99-779(+)